MKHTAPANLGPLFDAPPPPRFTGLIDALNVNGRETESKRLAAKADPATSHESARRVVASGQAWSNMKKAVDGVRAYPGKTSRELAELIGMDRHECARRLSDAEGLFVEKGPARKCTRGSGSAVTWTPVSPA